jgi:hypothetical protein
MFQASLSDPSTQKYWYIYVDISPEVHQYDPKNLQLASVNQFLFGENVSILET